MTDIVLTPQAATQRIDFDWGHLVWYAGGPLGNCREITVGCCVLRPGCRNPRHYHPNCAEVLVVLSGRIRHTGPNGQEVDMNAGDVVTVPPNVWHQAVNTGDEEAVLSIAFSSGDRETVGE